MINNILNEISVNEQISCEYLVVGSGAGGSVSAYEFAKANKDTLLIEEGNNYRIDHFKGSIGNSFNEANVSSSTTENSPAAGITPP